MCSITSVLKRKDWNVCPQHHFTFFAILSLVQIDFCSCLGRPLFKVRATLNQSDRSREKWWKKPKCGHFWAKLISCDLISFHHISRYDLLLPLSTWSIHSCHARTEDEPNYSLKAIPWAHGAENSKRRTLIKPTNWSLLMPEMRQFPFFQNQTNWGN